MKTTNKILAISIVATSWVLRCDAFTQTNAVDLWPSVYNCVSDYSGQFQERTITNTEVTANSRPAFNGVTWPRSALLWTSPDFYDIPLDGSPCTNGAYCGSAVWVDYAPPGWNGGAREPIHSVCDWTVQGFYRVTGGSQTIKYDRTVAGSGPGNTYCHYQFLLCELDGPDTVNYAVKRLFPDPSLTRSISVFWWIPTHLRPPSIPWPGGGGSGAFKPPSDTLKMPVDGNYGDTYTVQISTNYGSGEWQWQTNVIADTNNVSITNWTEATLTVPLTNAPDSLVTNSTGIFFSSFAGGKRSSTAGAYSVRIPAHAARAVAYQFYRQDGPQITNEIAASINGGALFTLEQGTNVETDLDSNTNWSPGATVLLPGSGGLMWNSNSCDLWLSFYGVVPEGPGTNAIPAGYSYQAWPQPQGYNLQSMEFPAAEGDVVYKWNTTSNAWDAYTYSSNNVTVLDPSGTGSVVTYWAPSIPQFDRGECFLVDKVYATNWVFNFPDWQRWTMTANFDSGAAVTKAQVICPNGGVSHPWTNGQDSVSLCPGDSLYVETAQDPNFYSWARSIGYVGVFDEQTQGSNWVSLDLNARENNAMWTVRLSNSVPILTREPVSLCSTGMIWEFQVFPTNCTLTIAGVDTSTNYAVWHSQDLVSWKSDTFLPGTNGFYHYNAPRLGTNEYFKVTPFNY